MDEVSNRIRVYIENWLKKHHNVGESSGGSGHLGSVSLEIRGIKLTKAESEIIANVEYDISVETEFTYYPDNPPKYTKYNRSFNFDEVGEIEKIHDSEILSTNVEFDPPDFLDDED